MPLEASYPNTIMEDGSSSTAVVSPHDNLRPRQLSDLSTEEQQQQQNINYLHPRTSSYDMESVYSSGSKSVSPRVSRINFGDTQQQQRRIDCRNSAEGQTDMIPLLEDHILSVPVPAIRFDHIGPHTWTSTNTFLYDFDVLFQRIRSKGTFYLIDELKLKVFFLKFLNNSRVPEDEFDFNGVFKFSVPDEAISIGLTSMDNVSKQSSSSYAVFLNRLLDFTKI
jgi:hypothetical protein